VNTSRQVARQIELFLEDGARERLTVALALLDEMGAEADGNPMTTTPQYCTCPCPLCIGNEHSRCYCEGTDDDMPQCPHCEQRYDLTGGCDGDKPECHAIAALVTQ